MKNEMQYVIKLRPSANYNPGSVLSLQQFSAGVCCLEGAMIELKEAKVQSCVKFLFWQIA